MKIIRDTFSMGLVASGLLGVQILLNDKWLWSAAPLHAYGLIGFVVIDLLLAMAVLKMCGIAILGTMLASVTQIGAMLADLGAGQPEGVPSVAFRAYLTDDASYLALLVIQVAILIVAIGTITEALWQRHAHWAESQHRARARSSLQ